MLILDPVVFRLLFKLQLYPKRSVLPPLLRSVKPNVSRFSDSSVGDRSIDGGRTPTFRIGVPESRVGTSDVGSLESRVHSSWDRSVRLSR